jgi:hypothetical protein
MIGWRGSRVRCPVFGDQPSRANNIQPFIPIRCNIVSGPAGHSFGAQVARRGARGSSLMLSGASGGADRGNRPRPGDGEKYMA